MRGRSELVHNQLKIASVRVHAGRYVRLARIDDKCYVIRLDMRASNEHVRG